MVTIVDGLQVELGVIGGTMLEVVVGWLSEMFLYHVLGLVALEKSGGWELVVEGMIGGLRLCLTMMFVVVMDGCLMVLHVVVVVRRWWVGMWMIGE